MKVDKPLCLTNGKQMVFLSAVRAGVLLGRRYQMRSVDYSDVRDLVVRFCNDFIDHPEYRGENFSLDILPDMAARHVKNQVVLSFNVKMSMEDKMSVNQIASDVASMIVLKERIKQLEEYVIDNAYCPCCTGWESCHEECTMREDAPDVYERIEKARYALGQMRA